jgi:thioredoxin reductase (NADPH)
LAKPALLAIDDDAPVLNAVERDLRQKYGRDFRILKAPSGAEGLNVLTELRRRGDTVALFVVDQRMPAMTGIEFLEEARKLFPEARTVLLTAYADTEAAIQAINKIDLDYYLMKPWDPPQEHLYPVLDDLIEEWKAEVRPPYEGIRVAGTLWSPASHRVKDFLVRHRIPYHWLDVEADAQARALVEEACGGQLRVPTIFLPDGTSLLQPDLRELADRLGLKTRAESPFYDLVIIGSGPAGLAAAVYASTEGIRCLVLERGAPGGLAGSSPKIENYLGFPRGISGGELARRAVAQARRFGAEILSAQEATGIRVEGPYRIVTLADGVEVSSHAVLIATGASFHTLNLPGAAELTGKGIYYGAAHTEAYFYRDQDVLVVGGANSAAQGALFLARYARKVTVIIRGPQATAARYLVETMQASGNIEILYNKDLVGIVGSGKLEGVVLRDNRTGEELSVPGGALFVFIGVRPQSAFVGDLLLHDEKGYLYTGPDLIKDGKRPAGWPLDRDPYMLETNVPGIFAAGDVRYGTSHRVGSATGEGAVVIALVRQYLKTV